MSAKHTPERLLAAYDARPPTPAEVSLAIDIATKTANRWRRSYCEEGVDHEDLVGEAMLAAWKALLTYEPGKGASLRTWLILWRRGAVIELLRRADPLYPSERKAFNAASAEAARNETAPPDPPRRLLSLDSWGAQDDRDEENRLPVDGLITPDPAERLLDQIEAQALVASAMGALPEPSTWGAKIDHRDVVRLLVIEERTQHDTAKALGISDTTVLNYWNRARHRMRAAVEAVR